MGGDMPKMGAASNVGAKKSEKLEEGIALCLSGGGFRATLFNLGTLWRLNELRLLPALKAITCVSGGSITAGILAHRWKELVFQNGTASNFEMVVARPLQEFCAKRIAVPSALAGILNPFRTIGDEMSECYEQLFGKSTLQDLPGDDAPLFIFYATSLQTGRSVRMTRRYLADYLVGMLPHPDISLARVVAASSAFPPILSPQIIKTNPALWVDTEGAILTDEKWRRELVLTDGGAYDNMGLEAVWDRYETVLVSDAGAPFTFDEDPPADWVRQPIRVMDIMTDQARALRKRWLIRDFKSGRQGAYWGINANIASYASPGINPIVFDSDLTQSLAKIRTHLDPFSAEEQGHLINWGYALTDVALRRWVPALAAVPGELPIKEFSLEKMPG